MSQDNAAQKNSSYYSLLGLHPSASVIEIRRAYRELSKHYHPDTTKLSTEIATSKFQELNQAYATLSNIERRIAYDYVIGYSRLSVIQAPSYLDRSVRDRTSPPAARGTEEFANSSAYLDPTDRPLSAGEIFALFILGLTIVGCLILAIAIGLLRGDKAWQPISTTSSQLVIQQFTVIVKIALQSLSNFP
ncbi:J domain-containing protein [Synechocystis sp. PCC 7509]|uniref:J domain-containing protein n=1 Tax=Synechocystis sp. PCC 7509 TaxID=927677 RepID=UPI0002AC543A|nr:J domain-containing protein [Synechocystis sp. PCC 7509]